MAGTTNVCNRGIMHARIDGRIVCGAKRAHMAVPVADFAAEQYQCKRCAKKLAGKRRAAAVVLTIEEASVLLEGTGAHHQDNFEQHNKYCLVMAKIREQVTGSPNI